MDYPDLARNSGTLLLLFTIGVVKCGEQKML